MEKIEDNGQTFKYDAFISYRHSDLDSFVAEKLHKMLENYKLPKNVKRRLLKNNPKAKTSICRVFRDEEELPLGSDLEESIVDALNSSEWLIVICSPRLKESEWCRKEIETFIDLHGINKVLAVLVEGEPKDSFPKELLYKELEVIQPGGNKEIVRKAVEPMAADVRNQSPSGVKRKLKEELVRICAPIFGLSYDELKQRHREYKLKRLVVLASIVAVASMVLFLVSFSVALTIKGQSVEIEQKNEALQQQKEQIELQNNQIRYAQARQLANSSLESMAHDDRMAAIQSAYSAITSYDGIEMPYTDEARYALTQSLNPYSIDDNYEAEDIIKANGEIRNMELSPDNKVLVVMDDSNSFTFWSVDDRQKLGEIYSDLRTSDDRNYYHFLDNNRFVYVQSDGLYIYDIQSGEEQCIYEPSLITNLNFVEWDNDNHRILVSDMQYVLIFDDSDFSLLFEYLPFKEGILGYIKYMGNDTYTFLTTNGSGVICDSDLNTICQFNNFTGDKEIRKILTNNGMMYIVYDNGIPAREGTIVYAYTIDGKFKWKWESSKSNFIVGVISYSNREIGLDDVFILLSGNDYIVLNLETGKEIKKETGEQKRLWIGGIDNRVHVISDQSVLYEMKGLDFIEDEVKINSCLTSVKLAFACEAGVFLVAPGGTEAIYYKIQDSHYSDEIGETFTERTEFDSISKSDEIMALGLPESNMIKAVVFDDNHEKACASRKDGKAVIYSLSDCSELTSFEYDSKHKIISYLGRDNEGNEYWASGSNGYCISPNNCLIANIEYLRGIDNDRNEYVAGNILGNSKRYSVPIYSLEELKEMAKEKLEKYGD